MKKNKRGWIKIAEAFVAILLLAGIVLFVINKGSNENTGIEVSAAVQDTEISILRSIELNNTLRAEVLATNGEVEWVNFPTQAPGTKVAIENKIPNNLGCEAKICSPAGPCALSGTQEKNIYAESVIITSTQSTFKPRLLKLFCWEK